MAKRQLLKAINRTAILNAIKMALVEQDIAPHQIVMVSGIGCGSKLPFYMKVTAYNTLHGRPVAVATGVRLADHGLKVMTVHGDGDGYGEGLSHFLNAARRNLGIVDLIQNNRVYGTVRIVNPFAGGGLSDDG